MDTKDGIVVMFGAGVDGPLDDLWRFSDGWTQLQTKGSKPCGRVVRSCGYSVTKNRLFVFGGGVDGNIAVNDTNTYCLDLGFCC